MWPGNLVSKKSVTWSVKTTLLWVGEFSQMGENVVTFRLKVKYFIIFVGLADY